MTLVSCPYTTPQEEKVASPVGMVIIDWFYIVLWEFPKENAPSFLCKNAPASAVNVLVQLLPCVHTSPHPYISNRLWAQPLLSSELHISPSEGDATLRDAL